MYESSVTVRMHHTDAAQVIFFGNIFSLCQEILEDIFEKIGMPITKSLDMNDLNYPMCYVVRCESDFLGHICLGDKLKAKVHCNKIGKTSFSLAYDLYKKEQLVAKATITHVCIDKTTKSKSIISEPIRRKLESL